jgi:hypothetical protein
MTVGKLREARRIFVRGSRFMKAGRAERQSGNGRRLTTRAREVMV